MTQFTPTRRLGCYYNQVARPRSGLSFISRAVSATVSPFSKVEQIATTLSKVNKHLRITVLPQKDAN